MARKSFKNLVPALALLLSIPALNLEAHDSDGYSNQLLDAPPEICAYLAPRERIPLTTSLDAAIVEITVHEGDEVAAGQRLVTFDCTTIEAQLNKAMALLNAAREKHLVMEQLLELKSVGSLETRASLAELESATADAAFHTARMGGCEVTAPVSGKVSKLDAHRGQYLLEGDTLMEIIDNRILEMEMVLPSSWLAWLRPGSPFSIKIDETGKTYPAKVKRIGAEVDPVSQTFKAIGSITGRHQELVVGMSGAAFFDLHKKSAVPGPQSSSFLSRLLEKTASTPYSP